MLKALNLVQITSLLLLSSCFSSKTNHPNNSPYVPTTYQSFSVTPYEDDFVRAENTTTDFRNTGESDSSVDSVRLHLKKSNTLIKIRKVKAGREKHFKDHYEVHISAPERNYSTSILAPNCGKFLAYVPTRGLVCWDQGNENGGTGFLRFDEKTGKADHNRLGKMVHIYRANAGHQLISDRTLLIDISRNVNGGKANQKLFTGQAHVYDKADIKKIESYSDLFDFKQTDSTEIKPEFIMASAYGVQLARVQDNSLIELTTFDKTLTQKSVQKNIFNVPQMPDAPTSMDYYEYSYTHGLDDVDYKITGRNLRAGNPSRMSFSLLKEHPDQKNWFVLIGRDGKEHLPPDAVGITPILVDEDIIKGFAKHGTFQAAHGWIVSYLDNSGKLVYGWASPELNWVSGPIWKNFYFHDRKCTPEFVHKKADFSKTSAGCYVLQYLGYFPGNDSTSKINQYTKPESEIRFVHGPLTIVQNMDDTWQAYTQQSYLFDTFQSNLATYNRPNNFNNSLVKAKTDTEAIAQAEKFLTDYKKQVNQHVQERHQVLLKHFDTVQKRIRDERIKEKIAKHEAEQKERDRLRMEAQARQDQIEAAQRSYNTAKAISAAQSGSFTNRLRNMSSAGSSGRAIQSLESMTNRLRKNQGKGYK